jgi:Fe-S-cluster-containing hydrogenase component 2
MFIKGVVAAGAAIVLEGGGLASLSRWKTLPRAQVAEAVIFPDPSLCIGCLTCEVICSRVHREQGLSAIPRIRIFNDPGIGLHAEIEKNYPGRGQFRQQPCLQCPTAECLYVCPVNAFQVEPKSGARIILEDVCVSCGRCANACPYPVFDESVATNQDAYGQFSRITYDPELDTYTKCDLCYWRPEGPACVERCPINIRIWQGIIKSDTLCLDMPRADQQTWERLRAFQTFETSPAPPPEAG